MTEDAELLRRYALEKSEPAFAEFVQRHVNLVYAVALRRVGGDAHLAQDVAQVVFTDLARKASSLVGHPSLSAWLFRSARFAAAQAMRAEKRRGIRELEAYVMQELTQPTAAESNWDELRPVIDEAMDELAERDRVAVWLRFYEGRSFAEVGAKLVASEDAVRVRVDRALERMRVTLTRRGVVSTTTALSSALAHESGVVAPAGFAASVTGAALTGAAAGGGIAAGLGISTFMSTTKLAGWGAAVATVLVSLAGNAYLLTSLPQRPAHAEKSALPSSSIPEIEDAKRRAQAAEADLDALLSAIKPVELSARAGSGPQTLDELQAALKTADSMASRSDFEGALTLYRQLFEAGPIGSTTLSRTMILRRLAKLGAIYPPTIAVMKGLRDASLAKIGPTANDQWFPVVDVVLLNKYLGDNSGTIALYENLPENDPRRRSVAAVGGEAFVAVGHYGALADAKPLGTMIDEFDGQVRRVGVGGMDRAGRDFIIKSTASNIETLVGANREADAEILIQRLRLFDNSQSTEANLAKMIAQGRAKRMP